VNPRKHQLNSRGRPEKKEGGGAAWSALKNRDLWGKTGEGGEILGLVSARCAFPGIGERAEVSRCAGRGSKLKICQVETGKKGGGAGGRGGPAG